MGLAFISDWLSDELGLSGDAQEKLLATLFTFVVLWSLRFALLRVVRRTDPSLRRQYYWRRVSLNVTAVLATIVVGRIWFSIMVTMSLALR